MNKRHLWAAAVALTITPAGTWAQPQGQGATVTPPALAQEKKSLNEAEMEAKIIDCLKGDVISVDLSDPPRDAPGLRIHKALDEDAFGNLLPDRKFVTVLIGKKGGEADVLCYGTDDDRSYYRVVSAAKALLTADKFSHLADKARQRASLLADGYDAKTLELGEISPLGKELKKSSSFLGSSRNGFLDQITNVRRVMDILKQEQTQKPKGSKPEPQ